MERLLYRVMMVMMHDMMVVMRIMMEHDDVGDNEDKYDGDCYVIMMKIFVE